jgi:hypothetical protein
MSTPVNISNEDPPRIIRVHSHDLADKLNKMVGGDGVNVVIMKRCDIYFPLQPAEGEDEILIVPFRSQKIESYLHGNRKEYPLTRYGRICGLSRIDGYPLLNIDKEVDWASRTNSELVEVEWSLFMHIISQ